MALSSRVKGNRPAPKRRGLKVVSFAIVVAAVGWLVYATVNIVSPSSDELQTSSDAVVSLAPQQNRLPLAKQLIADGVADTLVISYFAHDPMNNVAETAGETQPLSSYCELERADGVLCFTPEEDATIGEAHALEDIASKHSWNSLTVVTDSFHSFRTRFILKQCLSDEIDVNVVFAEPDLSTSQWVWHIVYENAAFLKAAWQTATRC